MSIIYINPYQFAAPWSPAEITTALWMDAADASTITESGGAVSQWDDKSGNSRNATSSSTSRPTYTANGLNNKPVVAFGGAQYMTFLGVHGSPWSIAIVGRASNINQGFVQFGGVNASGAVFTEAPALYRARSAGNYSDATAALVNNENVLLLASFSNAQNDIWKNGTQGTSVISPNAGAPTSNAASTLGGLSSTVYRLNGFIAEIIVLDGLFTGLLREQIEGYLAHKWGLTANLPAGHPYKIVAP
jgi:hypothetical protein